jgi:hypothetical protein
MKAITLRRFPPRLAQVIQKKARDTKTSINKTIISLLDERLGEQELKKKMEYHDLDDLSGVWSKEEAKTFEMSLSRQRIIDPDLWK